MVKNGKHVTGLDFEMNESNPRLVDHVEVVLDSWSPFMTRTSRMESNGRGASQQRNARDAQRQSPAIPGESWTQGWMDRRGGLAQAVSQGSEVTSPCVLFRKEA
eukprot:6171374-Amphidinium_carterae.2